MVNFYLKRKLRAIIPRGFFAPIKMSSILTEPGILLFEKRGFVVKESAGSISIPVIRIRGADGDVSVKWKTVDKTAISGRDYVGGEGELIFKHNEVCRGLSKR